jgi:hypothetical protein
VADSVSSDTAETAARPAPAQSAPQSRELRRPGTPLLDVRRRFGLAYLVLAAVVGAAVGLFIVFLGRTGSSGPTWSAFKPHGTGQEAAAQIAQYVEQRYKLPDGQDLVAVINREPTLQSGTTKVAVEAIAVRGTPVRVYRTTHTLFYALCGLSSAGTCAIPGQPSQIRALLLRREMLELSLLSFKYAGADSVIAYGPPTTSQATGKVSRTLAFLRRDDWKQALQRPLADTLPPRRTLTPASLTAQDARVAASVRLYTYVASPIGDGSFALVLSLPAA